MTKQTNTNKLVPSAMKEVWKIKDDIFKERQDWSVKEWLEADAKIAEELREKGLLPSLEVENKIFHTYSQ